MLAYSLKPSHTFHYHGAVTYLPITLYDSFLVPLSTQQLQQFPRPSNHKTGPRLHSKIRSKLRKNSTMTDMSMDATIFNLQHLDLNKIEPCQLCSIHTLPHDVSVHFARSRPWTWPKNITTVTCRFCREAQQKTDVVAHEFHCWGKRHAGRVLRVVGWDCREG